MEMEELPASPTEEMVHSTAKSPKRSVANKQQHEKNLSLLFMDAICSFISLGSAEWSGAIDKNQSRVIGRSYRKEGPDTISTKWGC